MKTINIQSFKTSVGELLLGSFNGKLCLCDWKYRKMRASIDARIKKGLQAEFVVKKDEVIEQAKQELNEYLNFQRKIFTVPLLMIGTDFQKTVWDALIKIPFGETSTYMNIAEDIANKNSVRAVANANGANAISIMVPCHRIIGSNGSLIGYAGGIKTKEQLLSLENDMFI